MAGGNLSKGTWCVHDHGTRAERNRRQNRARTAPVLVAAILAILAPPPASAETTTAATDTAAIDTTTGVAASSVPHAIALTLVAPGREGFELSARLMEGGGVIERPVGWTVIDASGGTVYQADTATADFSAPPGDYKVDIRYGAAHLLTDVSLPPASRLGVDFVLNVGAVRILSRVKGIGVADMPSRARVYAMAGSGKGELVAQSDVPGEILRVPAGAYRIESNFQSGNAMAVADVRVKPGMISAVEIEHPAGLARLAFVGAPDADVSWKVASAAGEPLAAASGLNANIVLKPGTYFAVARTGGEVLTAKFAITAGETRDIILGN